MAALPATQKQVEVKKLVTDFHEITQIASGPVPSPGKQQFLIKTRYVGINATDVNKSAGRHSYSSSDLKLPFVAGMEAVGEVVKVGDSSKFKVGQYVACLPSGAFAEYAVGDDMTSILLPSASAEFLALFVSGLTASVALEKEADLKPGKTVLVTAAAGGTGQYAVQLAKLAGCHVIGTCSDDAKAKFLKGLGCDRVVKYTEEDLNQVLSKEYPRGVDVVYECVGKEMFDAALKSLAQFGRLIVIGQVSAYKDDDNVRSFQGLALASKSSDICIPLTLMFKAASIRGMVLGAYMGDLQRHMDTLMKLLKEGKIKASTDMGKNVPSGPFVGLEKVADAVDHLFSRKNIGKVVVEVGKS
ncbi:prostaglandin reductase-3-like [Aplysia californica]|uniref:Prostaglandin reductase-3-like n=1 Tax=Aplysia californica TaxID=6500 RepID=A0ABM1VUN3_APLCA|nr:prostaglandin reductase-3-like [Aplysia californica]